MSEFKVFTSPIELTNSEDPLHEIIKKLTIKDDDKRTKVSDLNLDDLRKASEAHLGLFKKE